ncbi:hypothetical protein K2173_022972 [Erythroxylum novogranatense]|uniref:Pentatricopeptide repeat-containing protein n=1 Tax=Erythroxylum novogranatense TaxID=1862640 RepID=A0AAV8T9D5_9ROSI|nr:hypothetical protein K2173_022972 [Erythroxylum novogranatense]
MEGELHSLGHLLQSFNTCNSIHQGKQLHSFFFKKGLINSTLSLANRIIQMYIRFGCVSDGRKLFDDMPKRNCFSWNTIIEAHMKSGNIEKSIEFFNLMPYKNDYSWNVVIMGLVKAAELEVARRLFNDMPNKSKMAWTSIINGYARNGCPSEALKLFRELNSDPLAKWCSDAFVLASVVGACTSLKANKCGKQIHARVVIGEVELDPVLASSIVNFYSKCGDLGSATCFLNMMEEPDDFSLSSLITGYANCGRTNDARKIFDRIGNPCVEVWNSLISGHVASFEEKEAFVLLNMMLKNGTRADSSTIASILSACATLGSSQNGKQMHTYALKVGLVDHVVVACALIDAHAKSGSPNDAFKLFSELRAHDTVLLNSMITLFSNHGKIEDAKKIFNTMPTKTLISWNSMIVGLSQNSCPIDALDLFCQMNKLELKMDTISFASVISACASITSLELGEQVFARVLITGFDSDEVVCSSIVDFYCKCGCIEKGRNLFDTMIKSDEIPWNSMLMGYATNGQGLEALTLFNEMRHAGAKPNYVTFTSILSACNHCGLVEEGWKWFDIMMHDYHIDPGIEHYSCMVDLSARAGFLREAIKLIENMPFEADVSMWLSILRGCVAHGDRILGEMVAKRIIELDPDNSGAYVQLSSVFASTGEWESSALVRNVMRKNQVKKNPGYSWADC